MLKYILGIVTGIAVGYAVKTRTDDVSKRVHAAYILNDGKKLGGMVPCTRHPGNGLLMWSDGNLRCYRCGQEEFGDEPKEGGKPVVVYSPKQKQEMKDLLHVTW